MAQRHNHYEAAFEAFLRERGVPYVAVDEAKRATFAGKSVKNLDFIVSPVGARRRWLVDVKGRKFASGAGRQCWKNWTTRDDLESMARWQALFGATFTPLLVFAYEVVGDLSPLEGDQLFVFRQRLYAMVAIQLDHYASAAQTISPKWNTVAMPVARFREMARPLTEFLGYGMESSSAAESAPASTPTSSAIWGL